MTATERRERLLRLARERQDRAAVAILEADRTWKPEPPDLSLVAVWAGLRWRVAA